MSRSIPSALERARTRPSHPLGLIFLGVGVLSAALVRALHLHQLPFSVCMLKALTGWPCPSCGSTRALARLSDFDLHGAFAMNPLATATALLVAAWALLDLALLPSRRAFVVELGPGPARLLRAAVLAALAANWLYLVAAGR